MIVTAACLRSRPLSPLIAAGRAAVSLQLQRQTLRPPSSLRLRRGVIASEPAKFLWAVQEPPFPAFLFLETGRLIGVAVDDVTGDGSRLSPPSRVAWSGRGKSRQPALHQAADRLGSSRLIRLLLGPGVDTLAQIFRQTNGRYRVLPGGWTAPLFS